MSETEAQVMVAVTMRVCVKVNGCDSIVPLAETGSAALAVLDTRAVDAIVLDIMMPGM